MLRRIQNNLNSAYICPTSASRKAQQLISQDSALLKSAEQQARREQDRRCGRDRRQSRQAVMLDLRSSYARRKSGRRTREMNRHGLGLDVYV